jgi:iron complex outermembrane receptor protein
VGLGVIVKRFDTTYGAVSFLALMVAFGNGGNAAAQQSSPLPAVVVQKPVPQKPRSPEPAKHVARGARSRPARGTRKAGTRLPSRATARRVVAAEPASGGGEGSAAAVPGAYAQAAKTFTPTASFGPLGQKSIKDTPASITVVPQDVIVNQQAKQVNDLLHFLPSVEIRDQQGFDISRPQARGFQGGIIQNTRLDGLNVIGTTAIPAENLDHIEVLNGVSGALYGPSTPAGTFNYVLKRPTEVPTFRYIESFDSHSIFTEQVDAGGFTGPGNRIGYRINLVHGQGESYVKDSYLNRSLGSLALDYHFDNHTVLETNFSHYATDATGLPGSIVYAGKPSTTILPNNLNPTTPGLGQPGAGVNLRSDIAVVKFKHDFNSDWHFEMGGLYENAVRNLYGITNTLTDAAGNYSVTRNFAAVPRFTTLSNSAYLNGHVDIFGTKNDITIGTNGYLQTMYNYNAGFSAIPPLGTANLANPIVFPNPGSPGSPGQYYSGYSRNQSIITGDTLHFNDLVAVQGVLNTSFLKSGSLAQNATVTSTDTRNFALSHTDSLILTPTKKLTGYFTYASSIEQGDTALTGTANANQILPPYHDEMYEIGAKYAVNDNFLVSLAGFRMTRPYAFTQATTNIFAVGGLQRNYGVELFGQGSITPDLSMLGGVTWIDARLQNSGMVATDDRLIVGVPHWKLDTLFDYHPSFFYGGALTAAVHYEDARPAINTNTSYASSFASLDIGARYSATVMNHHATFRFQVINVNDARYYVSVADGNIVGSPGANTAYLGTPRTFQASMELDF